MVNDLGKFLDSIKKRKQHVSLTGVPSDIKGLISRADLLKVYNFILGTYASEEVERIHKKGETLRFLKNNPNSINPLLPRTLAVIRKDNGEFALMLETKSKLHDNTKSSTTPKLIGGTKFGKPSYRIDTPKPIQYASMVSYLSANASKPVIGEHDFLKEDKLNRAFSDDAQYVNRSYGHIYENYSKKACQYSPMAIGDLAQCIDDRLITEQDKIRIMYELLIAVKIFHEMDLVHQDIKGMNILVYTDEEGNHHIKLSDFGITTRHSEGLASATIGFESPEIFHANSDLDDEFYRSNNIRNNSDYYHKTEYYSLARDLYKNLKNDDEFKKSYNDDTRAKHLKSDKSNDMWALGIVFYKLMNKNRDLHLKQYEKLTGLLKGLLTINRNERLTIDQAIVEFEKTYGKSISPISVTSSLDKAKSPLQISDSDSEIHNSNEAQEAHSLQMSELSSSNESQKLNLEIIKEIPIEFNSEKSALLQAMIQNALSQAIFDSINLTKEIRDNLKNQASSSTSTAFSDMELILEQLKNTNLGLMRLDPTSSIYARLLYQKLTETEVNINKIINCGFQIPSTSKETCVKSIATLKSIKQQLEMWNNPKVEARVITRQIGITDLSKDWGDDSYSEIESYSTEYEPHENPMVATVEKQKSQNNTKLPLTPYIFNEANLPGESPVLHLFKSAMTPKPPQLKTLEAKLTKEKKKL